MEGKLIKESGVGAVAREGWGVGRAGGTVLLQHPTGGRSVCQVQQGYSLGAHIQVGVVLVCGRETKDEREGEFQ